MAPQIWQEDLPGVMNEGRVSFVTMNFLEETSQGQDIYYVTQYG
jgi:hypothetical protein